MKIFVTGATGFVGSAIVDELLKAGHRVVGLARSEASIVALQKKGAEGYRGDIKNPESLKNGAAACDAVIHTAFTHDFTTFKQNCENDRGIIAAMADAFLGTDKPLVVTSGIAVIAPGVLATEADAPQSSDVMPRSATEEAVAVARARGVNAYIVRLPPTVHGKGDHGFVPMVAQMARQNGESAYVDQGDNRWPAVHRLDAASLYRLIVEKKPVQKVFHAVAEQGIPFREIATAVGRGVQLPTNAKDHRQAAAHFGWFLHFASLDRPASSEQTRQILDWRPNHVNLLDDLSQNYF